MTLPNGSTGPDVRRAKHASGTLRAGALRASRQEAVHRGTSTWASSGVQRVRHEGQRLDMAVGIIIGAAFNKIVQSLVNDVIMPRLACSSAASTSDLKIEPGRQPGTDR